MNTPNRAVLITSRVLGAITGLLGLEHGIHELVQGNVATSALRFNANGLACVPEYVWHFCQPAMSWIQNYQITGIIAIVLGVLTLVWVSFAMRARAGGLGLIALSALLMNFGGGFIGPMIGFVGGITSLFSYRQLKPVKPNTYRTIIDKLFPGALIAYVAWTLLQWIIGTLANDALLAMGMLPLLLDVVLIYLAIHSAFLHDKRQS